MTIFAMDRVELTLQANFVFTINSAADGCAITYFILISFYGFRNIDESIKNICDFTVETIIESASICLRAIDPSLKVPVKLPSGISHRIEVAALIASFCKVRNDLFQLNLKIVLI